MDHVDQLIESYIIKSKKNSKLSRIDCEEISHIISSELSDVGSCIKYVDILNDMHANATKVFFEKDFGSISSEMKKIFVDTLIKSKKVINNSNGFGINRMLIASAELVQNPDNQALAVNLLRSCNKLARAKDNYEKAGSMLLDVYITQTRGAIFHLDYSEWNKNEIKNLYYWIDEAIRDFVDPEIDYLLNDFIIKYELPVSREQATITKSMPVPTSTPIQTTEPPNGSVEKHSISITNNTANGKARDSDQKGKIFSAISILQSEVSKLFSDRKRLVHENERLTAENTSSQAVIEKLNQQLADVRSQTKQFQEQLHIMEIDIQSKYLKIIDLEDRLSKSFKADLTNQNQEIIALKNSIAKSLRIEFEDLNKLKTKQCSSEYYQALIALVEDIFDTLRRKGIAIDIERN